MPTCPNPLIFRSFRVRKLWEASAERYEISKGKLLESVSETDYVNSFTVSPEDIDIIYSGDKELINKTFADELVNGYADEIYSAEWVYMHTPDNYLNDGIHFQKAINRLEKIGDFPFTAEAKAEPEEQAKLVRKT